jgi:GNAT superfamily N-acetyltransferase
MRIRRAEIGDALAIATVHIRSWQVAFPGRVPQDHWDNLRPEDRRERWEDIIGAADWPRKGVLVAEDHDVLGFAALCPNRDGDAAPAAVGEIAALYLSPDVWRRGIGGRLMAESLAVFREAGFSHATLWVLDTNERARRFYEACGWRADGTVKLDDSLGASLTELRYARAVP